MTRTKHCFARLLAFSAIATLFQFQVHAQCPQIQAIMIDACGTEHLNEFVIIRSGAGFNTSDIELDYDVNNNILGAVNNDINIDNNNDPVDPTPCGLVPGNTAAYSGCPNLISVGPGVDIPANAIVVLQNSSNSQNNTYNFASLCGAGQCIYVIASSCQRSAGGFTNNGGGTRTTNFSIAGTCIQTITYNLPSVPAGNGAYYLPLTNVYGNAGCVSPPSTAPSLLPPVITPIPNVTICGDYTLPPITGTNLTGNEAYYSGPNGTGTQYNAGDVITMPGTYYAFDQNGPVGCTDQEQFTVTIGVTPTVNQPADVTVCAGQGVNVPLTGSPAGTVFNWTNDNTAIGLGASGAGNIVFTSANVTGQEVALITVTPTQASCTGTPVTFSITVNPRPQVDDPPNQVVCGGDQVDVVFTGTGTNPTYNWTNSNPAIGLGASGNGDISFTANNASTTLTGTITVTASENGCNGTPQTFTITVNPTPSMNQPANVVSCAGQNVAVTFSGSAGAVFHWVNDNPAIGLGGSGTGNINFPAAVVANQEVATITVTPSNAAGTCDGTPVTFTITINPGPTFDNPGNQSVCGGQFVQIPLNSPTNPILNWTNSNPAIGLPANGSGDINFNAANVVSIQTGTITVTPTENGCAGVAGTFTITVSPAPFVAQPSNVTSCGGGIISVNFTGTPGATFNWTNDNTAIGLDPSGSGNILFTTSNLVFAETATITVTPNNGTCDGIPRTFTITVNPSPVMDDPANLTVCGLQPVNVVFTSPGNPTYTWTNSNTGIGLPASGSNNLNFTAANVVTNQTGTITVTPTEGGCPGTPETFTITVLPAPMVNQPGNITICAGQSILINFSGSNGAIFNWANSNTAIGLPASGTGNLSLTAAAVATQQTGTITVTPSNGTCNGLAVSFTITVNPAPVVNQPANVAVCNGEPVVVNFSGSANTTFNWTNNNPAIGLGASGSGNLNFSAAAVATTQTATITVTPVSGNCTGMAKMFTITVSPGVSVNNPGNQSACVGDQVTVNFTGTGNPTFTWTNDNPAIGLGASGVGNISFPAANVATPQTANITVTPVGPGCPGTPQTFTITVGPAPTLTAPANVTVCSSEAVNIGFNAAPGVTVNWTNSNPAIGLPATGSGNLMFTAATVTSAQTGTITATPSFGSCTSAAVSFTITITPGVSVDSVGDLSVCAGDTVTVPFTGSGNPAISWTNDNPAIGLPASGTGDINFVAANVTTPETATITVTPQLTGGSSGYAYITNNISGNVSVIDLSTNTVIATIPTGTSPYGVSVSPDGSRVYITTQPMNGGIVSVIDVNTNTIIATIPVGVSPTGIVVSPDGSRVYVSNSLSGNVSVLDAATNTVVATVPVGPSPSGITVHPDGTRVFVVSGVGNGFFSVIDVATNAVTATTAVGERPNGVQVLPDGSRAYVANGNTNDVSVVDIVTNTVIATIPAGDAPHGVAVSPNGSRVYVTNENSSEITVIDPVTNTVIATIPIGPPSIIGLIGLSITPDGSLIYVAQLFADKVAVVDAATNTVLTHIPAGISPVAFGNFIAIPAACPVAPRTFTITVNPVPSLPAPNNVTVCGNQAVNVGFTPTAGAIVDWTNSNPAIGLAASGNGDLSFTAANVATTQTATITATPILGNCPGTPVNFTVTINPSATGSIAGDLLLCTGDTTTLTASGGGTYQWAGGELTAAITVAPLVPTNYTVLITNPFNCTTSASVLVDVNQAPVAAITGNTTLCEGESTTLTASGGGTYSWNTLSVNPAITVTPQTTTTFTVTVTNAFSCSATSSATVTVNPADTINIFNTSCTLADTGTVVQTLQNQSGCDSIVISVTTFVPGDSTVLSTFTCDPNGVGTFTQQFTNQFGCDSIVVITITFNATAIDTTQLTSTTCDPSLAGVTEVLLAGTDGCDSLVITTVTLLPSDTVYQTASTCNPNQAGTFTQNLINQLGCDSTVVTTITFDPAAIDTTLITSTTCDASQAGSTQVLLSGADGCDSLVITNITLLPGDTVNLTASTCDPAQAGTFTQNLLNQFGCDSIVTTIITLQPADTVNLTASTCNPNQAGVFTQNLTNQFGCDSTVVTTVTFDPAAVDTVYQTASTCDPTQAGTTQTLLTGSDGCDSLVISTTTLQPSDTIFLSAFTCDPAQAGTFVQNLTNQFGCDSTVTTVVGLSPTDLVNLTATTCDPAQAGTFTQNLTNRFGCDSTVTTVVTLLPTDTVNLTLFTCDSSSAGIFTQVLSNQFGCDSTVITTSIFDPTLIDITIIDSVTCDPTQAGTTQTLLQGADGCDSIIVLTLTLLPGDTLIVSSFTCDPNTAGTFTQVLQNQFGCDSVLISEVIFDPFPCAPAVVSSSTNATCNGIANGSISLQIQNGQPPLQYKWVGPGGASGTGQITDISVPFVINNLPAGNYTLTVTDPVNGASTTATAAISQPPLLTSTATAQAVFNGFAVSCAGATDGTVNGSAGGGTPPYQFLWNTGDTGAVLDSVGAGAFSLVVTDANGCTVQSSANLTAPPPLSFALSVERPDCGDTLVDASIMAAGGVMPYTIAVDGNITSGTMPSLGSGAHVVSLSDANGCVADSTVTLNLPPAPLIFLPPDTSVIFGHPVRIEATTNLGAWDLLNWQPLPDTTCAACLVQEWTPSQSQLITVTIQDTFGCTARAVIRVLVEKVTELYVPNTFSPNEDGVHDLWQVNAGPSVTEIQEVRVYDRWGNLQYEWLNPVDPNTWPGWDGTTRGKNAGPGVYVYYLKVKLVDGSTAVIEGDVTIME